MFNSQIIYTCMSRAASGIMSVFARAVFVSGSERVVRWEGVSPAVLHQLHWRGYRGAPETDRHFLLQQTPPPSRLDNAVPRLPLVVIILSSSRRGCPGSSSCKHETLGIGIFIHIYLVDYFSGVIPWCCSSSFWGWVYL